MKLFFAAYFMMLGYIAKKYELPRRIGDAILDGMGTLAHLAGKSFSEGMADIGPSDDAMQALFSKETAELWC